MWTHVLLILRKNHRIHVSRVDQKIVRQLGQTSMALLATMEMIARSQTHVKTVNVTGLVLDAITIVSPAMAVIAVCILVMGM